MSRQAISVTLDADNVTWLRGRVRAAGARSLSDLIDRLVTSARESGEVGPSRSVAGTIDVDAADPLLKRADAAVRDLFDASLGRPVVARESRGAYGGRAKTRKRRG